MRIDADEILRGVNLKEMKGWEKLYAQYYAALCSYVSDIVKEEEAAEDVVQETLIKIWRSDRVFTGINDLTFYLYKSVYHNALLYLRVKKKRHAILRQIPVEEEDSMEEQFILSIREELIRQLYVYIEHLPEERRKIILLSLQGYSGDRIAEELGISINTVKTQKKRIFRFLRENLKDPALFLLISVKKIVDF